MQNQPKVPISWECVFFCGENWLSWVLAAPSCGVAVDAAFSPSGWLAWSCRGITVSSLENLERKRGEFRGPLMSLSMAIKTNISTVTANTTSGHPHHWDMFRDLGTSMPKHCETAMFVTTSTFHMSHDMSWLPCQNPSFNGVLYWEHQTISN